MSSESSDTPSASPLSPEQREAFLRAVERARKVRGATKMAAFNAWTLMVLGGLTVLLGLFSLNAIMLGGVVVGLGWNEMRGRNLLLAFDPQGPRVLGWNQLGLGAFIVLYCALGVSRALTTTNPDMAQLEELAGIDPGTVGQLTAMAYGAVIVGTILFQGLLARYYFLREQPLREYLDETPAWIVELQR